jgi:hypothetical protein
MGRRKNAAKSTPQRLRSPGSTSCRPGVAGELDDVYPEPHHAERERARAGQFAGPRRGRNDDSRHPKPSDIGILMEVGDATLLEDRRYKGDLYAQEKIAEFWLINVVERKIEVYTKPRAGTYQKKVEYTAKQIVPLVLDGVKIADIPVSELIAKT